MCSWFVSNHGVSQINVLDDIAGGPRWVAGGTDRECVRLVKHTHERTVLPFQDPQAQLRLRSVEFRPHVVLANPVGRCRSGKGRTLPRQLRPTKAQQRPHRRNKEDMAADQHRYLEVLPSLPGVQQHFQRLLGHNQVTDAYLLAVALANRAVLLTLDRRIAPSNALRAHIEILPAGQP